MLAREDGFSLSDAWLVSGFFFSFLFLKKFAWHEAPKYFGVCMCSLLNGMNNAFAKASRAFLQDLVLLENEDLTHKQMEHVSNPYYVCSAN